MPAVCVDGDPIARLHSARGVFVLELELGGAREQGHPFADILVVPVVRRTRLSGGYDAFDANARARQQLLELFGRGSRGFAEGKQVAAHRVFRSRTMGGMYFTEKRQPSGVSRKTSVFDVAPSSNR